MPTSLCNPYPADYYYRAPSVAIERTSQIFRSIFIVAQCILCSCFFYIPVLREYPNILLFFNSLLDMITQFYLLINFKLFPDQNKIRNLEKCKPNDRCIAGCFIYVFLTCCSMGLNMLVSVDLIFMLRNPFDRRSTVTKFLYGVIVFGISVLFAGISIHWPERIRYMTDKNTCFIADESHLLGLTITLPMLMCTLFNIAVLPYIFITLRRGLTSRNSQIHRMQTILRFTVYTIFTTFLWTLPLVGQLIPMFMPEVKYKMYAGVREKFNTAKTIFEYLQSLVDILIYASHPAVLHFFARFIGYCGDRERVLSPLSTSSSVSSSSSSVSSGVTNKARESVVGEGHNNNGIHTELPDKTGSYMPPNLDLMQTGSSSITESNITVGSGIDITLRRDVIMGLMYCMNYVLRPSSNLWSIDGITSFDSSHFNRMDKLYIQKPGNDPSKNSRFRNYTKVFTADQPIRYYIYAPEVFKKLREHFCGGDRNVLKSFPYPIPENAFTDQFSEGKSGSFFSKTIDERYIIKSVSKSEAKVLLSMLPKYMDYMVRNKDSFVTQIYGLYSIKLYQGFKMIFLVMSNIFPPKKSVIIHSRFDIKGSWVNRSNSAALPNQHGDSVHHYGHHDHNATGTHSAWPLGVVPSASDDYDIESYVNTNTELGEEEEIQVDPELRLDMDITDPLFITSENCEFVKRQLKMDADFLASCSIMDYSLLIGIHKCMKKTPLPVDSSGRQLFDGCLGFWSVEYHEVYFIGIIDILQRFNLSKKAEKIWKHVVLRKDKFGISSQPPDFYNVRFQEKIMNIFQ